VGPEALLIFLILMALWYWGRFLNEGRWQDSLGFGLTTTAALMTKGTGIQLGLIAALAIVFSGRWERLRSPSCYLPFLPVGMIAAPWYLMVPGAQHEAVARFGMTRGYFHWYYRTARWFGRVWTSLIPAFAGMIMAVRARGRDGVLTCLLLQIPCVAVLGSAIGVWELRNMQSTIPVMAFGIAALVHGMFPLLRIPKSWWTPAAAALLVAYGIWAIPAMRTKPETGIIAAEELLRVQPDWKKSVTLVVGSPAIEGQWISEIVMNDPVRPGRTAIRASKVMAASSFLGTDYRLLLETHGEIDSFLRSSNLDYVLIQSVYPRAEPHHVMTAKVLAADPATYERLGSFPQNSQVALYRVHGNHGGPVPEQKPNARSVKRP
jgi:hypothetical protein